MDAQYDKLSQQQINILQIEKEPKQSITYAKEEDLVSYKFLDILNLLKALNLLFSLQQTKSFHHLVIPVTAVLKEVVKLGAKK